MGVATGAMCYYWPRDIGKARHIMARHDAQSSRTAGDGLTAVEAPPAAEGTQAKDRRWFAELAEVTEPLSLTGEGALRFIAVVVIGSFGMAYWGAYTDHFYVTAVSVIVFILAMVAWGIVACWRVWAVVRGGVKWWRKRRHSGRQLTDGGAR